jgi:hypothetical protein
MIKDYLNQDATWSSKTGDNEYGESVFADAVLIKVRWEHRRRFVRNSQGKEVVSESEVICIETVQVDDVLTYSGQDHIVITVSDVPGLNGDISHREVAV